MSKWVLVIIALAFTCAPVFAEEAFDLEKLTCSETLAELSSRIELYSQVGNAYLQAQENLGTVYRVFSPQVSSGKNNAEISRHFDRSAENLSAVMLQNKILLEKLKTQTALLRARAEERCIDRDSTPRPR